ncbi:MAG: rhomboid family intramembrane serine protease [Opitutaceae bacterium]
MPLGFAAMLSDRPYLRDDYPREKTSALIWLLSAIVAGSALQMILGAEWFRGADRRVVETFGLSISALKQGHLWTLLTYSFLHSTGFIFHVIVNGLALFFLGRELAPILGTKRFLGLYAAAILMGALAWAGVHWNDSSSPLIGATAGVMALLAVFSCFFPNERVSFLLFFAFPVTLKPKHVLWTVATLEGLGLTLCEIPAVPLPFDLALACSAHLGGLAVGLLYHRFVHHARWFNPDDRAPAEPVRQAVLAHHAAQSAATEEFVPTAPPKSRDDIRAEVDRILDKINSEGMTALSAEEKRVLAEAKSFLGRP